MRSALDPRRRHGLVLLAWVLTLALVPLLLAPADACDDDGCPPACGDCLACGLLVAVPERPQLVAPLSGASLPAGSEQRPAHAAARPLDHVPLLAV